MAERRGSAGIGRRGLAMGCDGRALTVRRCAVFSVIDIRFARPLDNNCSAPVMFAHLSRAVRHFFALAAAATTSCSIVRMCQSSSGDRNWFPFRVAYGFIAETPPPIVIYTVVKPSCLYSFLLVFRWISQEHVTDQSCAHRFAYLPIIHWSLRKNNVHEQIRIFPVESCAKQQV